MAALLGGAGSEIDGANDPANVVDAERAERAVAAHEVAHGSLAFVVGRAGGARVSIEEARFFEDRAAAVIGAFHAEGLRAAIDAARFKSVHERLHLFRLVLVDIDRAAEGALAPDIGAIIDSLAVVCIRECVFDPLLVSKAAGENDAGKQGGDERGAGEMHGASVARSDHDFACSALSIYADIAGSARSPIFQNSFFMHTH